MVGVHGRYPVLKGSPSFMVLLIQDLAQLSETGFGSSSLELAASFANLSGISLPGMETCPGTHWMIVCAPAQLRET